MLKPVIIKPKAFAAGIACLLLFISAAAQAQFAASDGGWDEPRPIMPTPAEEMREHERFAEGFRDRRVGGLMREGAHLMAVRGIVQRDDEAGSWIARLSLQAAGDQMIERDMRLLPNAFLGQMQEIVRSTPEQRITFEMTGEMFVYQGRNYLLLRAPARVVEIAGLWSSDAERSDDADDGLAKPQADLESDAMDSGNREASDTPQRGAAEVMRQLEREAGPLVRTTRQESQRDSARADRAQPDRDQPRLREGSMLVQRRGRITRDAGGAWIFIFDADSQGLADPPLTLMPCLLLERIERYARQAGPTAPILISGQIFVFEGRGYLMPSSFQLPRERTALN